MKKSVFLIATGFLLCQAAFAQRIAKPALVSDKVMNAEFQSLDGSASIKLSDYRGKIIVLSVWASWCGPCRMAALSLNALHQDFTSRGVEVIGLSIENPKSETERVEAFVSASKLEYKLGWVNEELAKELLGEKTSIPQILILTDEGVMIKRFTGFIPHKMTQQLSETVEQALINPPIKQ